MEEWRQLLYPLGLLSTLAFGARFIVQWLESERKGMSIVPLSFWQLSLIGNILLTLHSMIQSQFPVAIAQVCNSIISWRNLNLLQVKKPPVSFHTVLTILLTCCTLIILYFIMQQTFFFPKTEAWFRIPLAPWENEKTYDLSLGWHLLGFVGYLLFSSRFWIQWWFAEKAYQSYLPLSFWWLSLIGAVMSNLYFLYISDIVNLIGPVIGLVPYIRNLMLIYAKKKVSQST